MNIALACSLGNLYRWEGFPLLLVSLLVVRNLNFDLFCPSVLCLPFIDFVIVSFSNIFLSLAGRCLNVS